MPKVYNKRQKYDHSKLGVAGPVNRLYFKRKEKNLTGRKGGSVVKAMEA
jgi:hypothetical protein